MDRRCIGGRVGRVGVLHTWTHDLRSHPPVHSLVTGGGLADDGPVAVLPSRLPGPCEATLCTVPRHVLRATAQDPLVASGGCPSMATGLGRALSAGRQWPGSLPVSRAVHLSGGPQQSPHPAARGWHRHVAGQGLGHCTGAVLYVPKNSFVVSFQTSFQTYTSKFSIMAYWTPATVSDSPRPECCSGPVRSHAMP